VELRCLNESHRSRQAIVCSGPWRAFLAESFFFQALLLAGTLFFCLAVEAYVRAVGCTAIDKLFVQLWLLVNAAV